MRKLCELHVRGSTRRSRVEDFAFSAANVEGERRSKIFFGKRQFKFSVLILQMPYALMHRSSSAKTFGFGRRFLSALVTLALLAAIYFVYTTGVARLNETTIIVSIFLVNR